MPCAAGPTTWAGGVVPLTPPPGGGAPGPAPRGGRARPAHAALGRARGRARRPVAEVAAQERDDPAVDRRPAEMDVGLGDGPARLRVERPAVAERVADLVLPAADRRLEGSDALRRERRHLLIAGQVRV